MTEQHADLSAFVAVRLGSREDRHRGLLFGGSMGLGKVYFTVRDRADTDQIRRRPRTTAAGARARALPAGAGRERGRHSG
ncbi:hypothetical protein ACPCAC_31250 [Streptomyces lavendulocolor]|uniref:hypothetical protein n=1 Tax=Streptomyces lavendulocolor TaxID=67316 RepID=UPI003C2D0344